jgi:tetratricopeptide (TPR) repeat protein
MFFKQLAINTNSNYWKYAHLILGLLAFVLYAQTISFDYNMDDELVTKKHIKTSKGMSAIKEIFTTPYYEDNMGYAYDYRPITLTSFAIEHHFLGESPSISHFVNIILYALCCILLFKFLLLLFGEENRHISIIATLLFIIHPLHTEVVASIKNRDEILALTFALISFIYFVKAVENNFIKNVLIANLFFIFSILSKGTIVVFAFLIPLWLIFFNSISFKKLLIIILTITASIILFFPYGGNIVEFPYFVMGLFVSLIFIHVIVSWKKYLNQIINVFFESKKKIENSIIIEPNKGRDKNITLTLLSDFKHYFSNIKEDNIKSEDFEFGFKFNNEMFRFVLMIFTVCIISLCFGLYFNNEIVLKTSLIISLVLVTLIKNFNSKKFFVLIYSLSILLVLKFLSFHVFYSELFSTLIMINLFRIFKNKLLTLTFFLSIALINYLTNEVFLFPKIFSLNFSFLIIYILYVFKNSFFGRIFSFIFLTIIIIHIGVYFFESTQNFDFKGLTSDVLVLIIMIFLNFKLLRKFIVPLQMSILALGIIVSPLIAKSTFEKLQNTSLKEQSVSQPFFYLSKINYSNVAIKKEDRELSFVEKPIKYEDPIDLKLGTSLGVMNKYLQLHVLPIKLLFYYGYAIIKPIKITNRIAIFSLIVHFAVLVIAFLFYNKNRRLSYFILFYLTCLAAVSSFVFVPAGMVGERFTFLSSVGFVVVLSIFISNFFKYKNNQVTAPFLAVVLLLVLVGFYSYNSIARTSKWKNHLTLMLNDIENAKESAIANNLLATQLVILSFEKQSHERDSLREESLKYYNRALEIYPEFFNVAYDIGRVNLLLNNKREALKAFEKAFYIDTTSVLAIEEIIFINTELKRISEIEKYVNKLSEYKKLTENDFFILSDLYYKKGDTYKSMKYAVKGLEAFPNSYALMELVRKNSL